MSVRAAAVAVAALVAASSAAGAEPVHDAVPMPLRPAIYTCGGLPFPKRALRAPVGAERRQTAPARALREFLRDEPGFPRRSWRVLAASARAVDYDHDGPRGRWRFSVSVTREAGAWEVTAYGECVPRRVVRGFNVNEWTLGNTELHPSTRVVDLSVHFGACERFHRVEVSYGRRAVNLLVLFRPDPPPPARPGEVRACIAIGYVRTWTVRLPAPIGRRALQDASTTPPAPARRVAR